MRLTRIILIVVILLATMAAAAQELTQTSTFGNVTVSYPQDFSAEELALDTVGVADPTNSFGVVLMTGETIAAFGFPAGATAKSLFANPGAAELTGDVTPISLPNGEGGVAPANISELGSGLLYAVDTEGGLVIGFATAGIGIDLPAGFDVTAQAIVGSVILGSSESIPESTAMPETPTASATPGKGTDSEDTVTTGIDGSTCPIPVADMPENTLVFCPGVVMTLPGNWSLTEGTTELDTFASISRENFSISLSTTVSEVSPFYSPETYIRDVLPFIADTVGHTTFDPSEHVETVFEEPGYKAVVYNPELYVDDLGDNDVRQLVAIITLNNDLFVTHTFTWVPSIAGEGIEPEIEQIVASTHLADFYDDPPAFVELDGEVVFIHEATWIDSTYSFRLNDEPTLIVVCPPGGIGNEASVWGTDIYTHNSSICLAAAHTGAISLSDGGTVKLTMLPGQESYKGTSANGVTTSDYPAWTDSFMVEPFDLP